MDDEIRTDSGAQLRLRLTTRDQALALADNGPILVPTSFRRIQLSTLVNGLLQLEKTIPLEFLVNGSFLQTTIEDYITQKGISTETTLSVEYVRAKTPPQYVASFEHDDAVADVDVFNPASTDETGQARILTASYDGLIRVWNTSSQVLATSGGADRGGHLSYVYSAKFLSASRIASASFDNTIRLWRYTEGETPQVHPQFQLLGHGESVRSICAHSASQKMLSASSDRSVRLWSTDESDLPSANESSAVKSGKGNHKRQRQTQTIPQRESLSVMQHTEQASEAIFDVNDTTVGYSTSWDQIMRTWDLATSREVDKRETDQSLFCIKQMADLRLLACGSSGADIKLLDPRTSATAVSVMTLRGHQNFVTTLACDPVNRYRLVSGSNDGTCRVWDIRNTKNNEGKIGQSLHTIKRHSLGSAATPRHGEGVKVFGVCWDKQIGLLSAGEDRVVQINSMV